MDRLKKKEEKLKKHTWKNLSDLDQSSSNKKQIPEAML